MRIAMTGSSSTGKTTLVSDLLCDVRTTGWFSYRLNVDARRLLREMGHRQMDEMTVDERRRFQRRYFQAKRNLEDGMDGFITERSFVDVAAFWTVRETFDDPDMQNELVIPCEHEARKYDLHVYAPFGQIPFASDGYRSEDIESHRAVGDEIWRLLQCWKLRVVRLDTPDRHERVELVINALSSLP